MSGKNLRILICKTLLRSATFLLLVAFLGSPVLADQGDAGVAISAAQNRIMNCYIAAKKAEALGANITVITATLDEAGLLLSQAELAYFKNDFDAATNFATQSQSKLNNFVDQADALGQAASQRQSLDFLINVVGSIVGAFAVVIAGFAVWVFLRRKYETGETDASGSSEI